MKVNRIRMSAIQLEWQILLMRSAYIAAEQLIVNEASKGNDLTGIETVTEADNITWTSSSTTPEDFFAAEIDQFGNIRNISEAEMLLEQARELRKQLDNAIQNEEYDKAKILQDTLDKVQIKYNKLKGNG